MKRSLSLIILILSFLSYFLVPWIAQRANKVVSQDVLTILPEDAPASIEFKKSKEKFKVLDLSLLIMEANNKEELLKFYDEFKHKTEKRSLPHVSKVIWNISEIVKFYDHYSALYIPEDVYLYILTCLEKDKFLNRGKAPKKEINLLDQKQKTMIDLKRSFKNTYFKYRNIKFSRFKNLPQGKFISEDGKMALAIIVHPEALTSLNEIKSFNLELDSLINDIKQKEKLNVSVTKSGDTNALYNEYVALWDGFEKSAILSLIFTFFILFALFRNVRAIFLIAHSLMVGIVLSSFFIVNHFDIINSNSIFLLIVVMGNAVNSNIVLLHYYLMSRHDGLGPDQAAWEGLKRSIWPTSFAVATSCIVYFSFYGSAFRGYHDMAIVGSVGMLITWVSGILILMSSFLWKLGTFSEYESTRYICRSYMGWDKLFGFVIKNYRLIFLVSSIVIILSILNIKQLESLREVDSNQLKNEKFSENSLENISPKLEKVGLGIEFLPQMVVVTENESTARNLQNKINEDKFLRLKLPNLRTFTINDLLPRNQEGSVDSIKKIKKSYSLQDIIESPYIDEWQEKLTRNAFSFDTNTRVSGEQLPVDIKSLFIDRAGNIGNVIYLSFNLNKLERDVRDIRSVVEKIRELSQGQKIYLSGTIPLLAEIEKISYECREEVLVKCSLLVLLLIIIFNFKTTQFIGAYIFAFLSIASFFYLFILLTGTKINLLNFMAIPMTMALGIDYISNYAKGFEFGLNNQSFQHKTFSMVVTMSFTTTFGYLSIYLTSPQLALMSFAKLAIVGELITLFGGLIFFFSFLSFQEFLLKRKKVD
ncbi:MAG: MMPL family transporter [Bacteriovoracaceae bacterium]